MDNGMDNFVTLGRVAAHYGVKGWVKLRSYTRPAEEIFAFDRWTVRAAGAGLSAETLTLRCLLYTSPSPRDATLSRMPSSA